MAFSGRGSLWIFFGLAGVIAAMSAWGAVSHPQPAETVAVPPLERAEVDPEDSLELSSPQQRGARGGMRGVYRASVDPHWFADNTRFWYRNDLRGGSREFILVDAATGTRQPAFDHAKLAAELSTALERQVPAGRFPFDEISPADDGTTVQFTIDQRRWLWDQQNHSLRRVEQPAGPPPQNAAILIEEKDVVAAAVGDSFSASEDAAEEWLSPQQGTGRRGAAATGGGRGRGRGGMAPDRSRNAVIRDGNVFLVSASDNREVQLTTDGTSESPYGNLEWSPDSKSLVAWRTQPGDRFEVHLLESSPARGGRAVLRSRAYPLPGDKFTSYELHLFQAEDGREIKPAVDVMDFGRPQLRWDKDRRHFAYQQVDRGHQRFRIIRVDAATGEVVNLIDEKTDTFIWTAHTENVNLNFVNWLERTSEIVYASERDGWRHLYLVDARQGGVKNQITRGTFVVRAIDRIDEEHRQVWFQASGGFADQDPYLLHHYRVDFSGENLVALTAGNGQHSVQQSPDGKFLIDTYSRVDMAPVSELRRTSDGSLVCDLERADITELVETGWKPPEVFVAKGRDDVTDIWGIIARPRDYDPTKKYPVIESIYAGPQGSYVPKTFNTQRRFSDLTDLGFIVVQMDGMGTANRSKAFHDVCWHDLADAGFPDRIKWIRAAAAKDPGMDLDRVGLYGSSAGGQNAAGGLLFHPEFYKVGAAGCGCHDNRMDKASWNEQWMGYPVGPQYSRSSNIDNAARLQGKLLLIVGELDDNVPPESTLRFADALIKADKDFDMLVVPGAGHGWGGAYGTRRMRDFFVRHLLQAEDANRNGGRGRRGGRGTAMEAGNDPAVNRVALQQPDSVGGQDGENVAPPPVPRLDLTGVQPQLAGMEAVTSRFRADLGNLTQFYAVSDSPRTAARMREFAVSWLSRLNALPQDQWTPQDRAGYDEVISDATALLVKAERDMAEWEKLAPLLPFREAIVRLAEQRQEVVSINPEVVAGEIAEVAAQAQRLRDRISRRDALADYRLSGSDFRRAGEVVEALQTHLARWFQFYDGYDPVFSWWMKSPYEQAGQSLQACAAALKEVRDDVLPPSPSAAPLIARHVVEGAQVPDLLELARQQRGVMPEVLSRYQAGTGGNRGGQGRRGAARTPGRSGTEGGEDAAANTGRGRGPDAPLRATPQEWLAALQQLDFASLSRSDQVDYLLLRKELQYTTLRGAGGGRGGGRGAGLPVDESGIRGTPIGRDALLRELQHEMIPYTPEELIEIAEIEYDWCHAEMLRASREMGCGEDWRAAVEKVKGMHVPPGKQPELIRDLAWEAITYLEQNDLITLPPIAAETWRMQMMTPERQLVNPFFTGGASISVSFPTESMTHDAKLQSLRGNNIPFARATVHHELIPGHNLQQYMNARYSTHRRPFSTPFWGEGWALYWELLLYDRGFPQTPEDRVGFLVWRSHRCARIIFSLSYHLGRMTPQECIDFLVAKVGFDRNNSAAEVKRSFEQAEPLYQAAYLLGGLQFWGLRQELVVTGKLTDREFHDRILQGGSMPVRMVRAALSDEFLSPDGPAEWRFHVPPK